jgi:hypothetical protein
MLIDEEELRTEILGKLKEWVNVMPNPDKEIIGMLGPGPDGRSETLSANDIVAHVERRTTMGDQIVQHWVRLALNHIMTSTLLRKNSGG